ncbi:hypothetical protein [Facklamia sp. P9177]|uniref:hypothetical protein n=1 Tax=Facklamia sp. P9177 TaxID=3421945 RepID=UPI003D16EB85
MDEFMRQPILYLVIFIILNIVIAIMIKNKSKFRYSKENSSENKKTTNVGTKIFSLMIIPTIILVFLVADTFIEFIYIYLYFMTIVFISDRYSKI